MSQPEQKQSPSAAPEPEKLVLNTQQEVRNLCVKICEERTEWLFKKLDIKLPDALEGIADAYVEDRTLYHFYRGKKLYETAEKFGAQADRYQSILKGFEDELGARVVNNVLLPRLDSTVRQVCETAGIPIIEKS